METVHIKCQTKYCKMERTKCIWDQGWGLLEQFPPFLIGYQLDIMFIFDRCRHSSAAVASDKYECDSKNWVGAFVTSQILFNEQSFSNLHPSFEWTTYTGLSEIGCTMLGWTLPCRRWERGELRGHFKNTYELLNLRALKFSPVNKMHIFQCMGKIFCVEFQRVRLKFHTKYLTHTLKDNFFMKRWNVKSS